MILVCLCNKFFVYRKFRKHRLYSDLVEMYTWIAVEGGFVISAASLREVFFNV